MAGNPGMLLALYGVAKNARQKVEKAMTEMKTNGADQLQLIDSVRAGKGMVKNDQIQAMHLTFVHERFPKSISELSCLLNLQT